MGNLPPPCLASPSVPPGFQKWRDQTESRAIFYQSQRSSDTDKWRHPMTFTAIITSRLLSYLHSGKCCQSTFKTQMTQRYFFKGPKWIIVVFCHFNRQYKLREASFAQWGFIYRFGDSWNVSCHVVYGLTRIHSRPICRFDVSPLPFND